MNQKNIISESEIRQLASKIIFDIKQKIFEDTNNQNEIEIGKELIDKHNANTNGENDSYYIISITGNLQQFYTLYYFSKPVADFGKCKPFMYRGNLSQNFLEAVKKVISRYPGVYIKVMPYKAILDKISRYKSEVFHSGKYQGKSFDEVYEIDPKYILWYYNKLKEESQIMKKNNWGHVYYLTKKQEEIFNALEPFVKTYHEEQINTRKETIDSVHIENGNIQNVNFVVINTPSRHSGTYGTYIDLRGKEGNKYYVMYMKDNPSLSDDDIKQLKGKTVSLQSAKVTPTEIYGVKYNKLSYVKGFEIH